MSYIQNYNKVNQVNVFCTAEARNQHLQQEHEGEEYEDIELDGPYFKQRKVQYYLHQVISKCFNLHYLSFKSLLILHAALHIFRTDNAMPMSS